MILSTLLSENSTLLSENTQETVDAIVKPHYTPNMTGIQAILLEHQEMEHEVEENIMLAEQAALAINLNGNEAAYEKLNESVVSGYFTKAIEMIKRMWAKIKGWFANLLKNVEASTRDIASIINKYEKELKGKDYSNFEYKGHNWKTGAAEKFHTHATNVMQKAIEASVTDVKIGDNADAIKKTIEEMKEVSVAKLLGEAANSNDEMSQQEFAKHVKEEVAGEEKTIKGFQFASVTDMIAFIKEFKQSKTIKKAQTDTDKLYSKAIAETNKAISKAQTDANKISDTAKKEIASLSVAAAREAVSVTQRSLNVYNIVTGVCIDLEKAQFTEYKKVIASAIRYKG